MVNLHNLVRSAISSINPDQTVQIKKFIRQEHQPGGIDIPVYSDPITVVAQAQPVASDEIQHINNYVSSSKYENLWITGNWQGLNRRSETGGDIIIWNGHNWYIDDVAEDWDPTAGWTKVRCVQQLPEEA